MITVMDDLDMHDIENNHLDEENHQFGSTDSEIFHNEENQSETQDMNDIGNDHYDEENHQFSSCDSEILHNDGNQSEIQVQSDNVAAQYGSCKQFIGADGSLFWIPEVEANWIPIVGSIFKDIKDIIKWYKGYALRSSFDIRKSTERKKSGITTSKYFICNRGGLPNTSTLDTISDHHNKQLINKVYLWRFEQQHNHKLINQDCMHLSRAKRHLNVVDQAFIHKLSSAKVGETTTYRLMCVIKGGCEFVDGLEIDWKIFTRDINCHIGGTDANLLITKLQNRKENVTNFTYEYKCDKKQLNALFWADDTLKQNFELFGDVVSFDATYRTNRYCMVFVPFSDIDNHKRCITFGAGLLCREDTNSYIWLLRSFLKCFGKAPIMVVTDQDPAMKKAIEIVSWETMNESDFKADFNSIVWDPKIFVNDFEMRWDALMVKYKLQDNKWMKDMFDLRSSWIPTYFKDVPMSGLMRTTSRSESENSAFNRVSHHGYTLNNFMNAFESVMERQRNNQIKFDFDTSTITPIIKTPLEDMEKHASMVYTRTIFLMVQREILHSLVSCSQKSVTSGVVSDICIVKHKRTNISKKKVVVEKKEKVDIDYEWNFNTSEGDFEIIHIFCILKIYDIQEIPSRYILKRWRRDIIPTTVLKRTFRYGDSSGNVEKVAYKAFSMLDQCLSSLSNDDKKLEEFMQKLEVFMTGIGEQGSGKLPVTKEAHIDKLYGTTTNPEIVDVENPPMVKNKGSGTGKRLKSALEKATIQGNKQSRS
ncbi:protein FAR1-RELATED SEQUENCE 5-like [Lactuca sativa]|uniref:protein FAR1-RELATED SEQUENCE 5-like n=1 Tax=Lactuca sativa TaxID=4236 RepID=UPI0022AFDFEA|nr:protein FAR1-RELATED SEQUENCE 5-like [Lactuca sativa]